MASIAIKDLPASAALDYKALSAIRGAGAGWVFGWIRPFVDAAPSLGPVINLFQFNNFGGQMNNQLQLIDINNSASNAVITVRPEQLGINFSQSDSI
jgi:hypothetical protein